MQMPITLHSHLQVYGFHTLGLIQPFGGQSGTHLLKNLYKIKKNIRL